MENAVFSRGDNRDSPPRFFYEITFFHQLQREVAIFLPKPRFSDCHPPVISLLRQDDGSVEEHGSVIHQEMKGSAKCDTKGASCRGLSAFVLQTLAFYTANDGANFWYIFDKDADTEENAWRQKLYV